MPDSSPPNPVQIMEKIRREAARDTPATGPEALARLNRSLEALGESARELERQALRLGRVPASPPTLRARVSGWLIRALDRVFWWQSAPLREFGEAIARHEREEARRWEAVSQALAWLHNEAARPLKRIEAAVEHARGDIALCGERLAELERAQLEVQAAALDHATTDELAELRERLDRVLEDLKRLDPQRV